MKTVTMIVFVDGVEHTRVETQMQPLYVDSAINQAALQIMEWEDSDLGEEDPDYFEKLKEKPIR